MRRFLVGLSAALALVACNRQKPAPQAPPSTPKVAEVKGKLLERLDAPPYSYLRLETPQGETWAAVISTNAVPGAEVTVVGAIPMNNFESKTLHRKFDLVYFGTLGDNAPRGETPPAVGAGMPPSGMGAGMPPSGMGAGMPPSGMGAGMPPSGMGAGMPPSGMGAGMPPGMGESTDMVPQHSAAFATSNVGDVKVQKAAGPDGRTIAELYAQRTALKAKDVTVRGKVVRFNGGIMGRNWIHLRDGTGTADKDGDLTVTSDEKAAVGDVVVVRGTVQIDQDFGTGHPYAVIVEDAKVSK